MHWFLHSMQDENAKTPPGSPISSHKKFRKFTINNDSDKYLYLTTYIEQKLTRFILPQAHSFFLNINIYPNHFVSIMEPRENAQTSSVLIHMQSRHIDENNKLKETICIYNVGVCLYYTFDEKPVKISDTISLKGILELAAEKRQKHVQGK